MPGNIFPRNNMMVLDCWRNNVPINEEAFSLDNGNKVAVWSSNFWWCTYINLFSIINIYSAPLETIYKQKMHHPNKEWNKKEELGNNQLDSFSGLLSFYKLFNLIWSKTWKISIAVESQTHFWVTQYMCRYWRCSNKLVILHFVHLFVELSQKSPTGKSQYPVKLSNNWICGMACGWIQKSFQSKRGKHPPPWSFGWCFVMMILGSDWGEIKPSSRTTWVLS